jgi:putative membrane protein
MTEPGDDRRTRRVPLRDVGTDPDYRFSLANERTFLAWIRTSLALLAGGIAVVQLAPDLGPRPLRLAVGVALIVISGVIAGAAHHRWAGAERAMRLGATLPPNRLAVLLGYGLAIIALVVLIVMLVSGGAR